MRTLRVLSLSLILGSATQFGLPSEARAQDQPERLQLAGLDAPVEIITDRWGIAHIYAETEADLFFAQGFNAARDRLFQFEMWRRKATGTSAEILGRRALEDDIGSRLHRFRGDLTQELNHYHPRGAAIINAFVRGINAYIEMTDQNPELLPVEFRLLGIAPGRWTPEVVISRHQGLLANVTSELAYGRAVARVGPGPIRELSWFRPGEPDLVLDPAIDGALLTDEILDIYRAFKRPMRFEPDDIVLALRADRATFKRLSAAMPIEADLAEAQEAIGSNNWVIGGGRTLSGFPFMANDPHRVQQAPSLRYWVHLVGPGWNVIGGGEPVLPGISIGHNEHGAWGLTVFGQDSEDLYVYDTNPDDPLEYRYLDQWERMRVVEEQISVKGEPPVRVQLKYTRHGPVQFEDLEHDKAYALRAAWLDVGAAPYLASLRMDQARTWEEFREACSYSRIPAENMIWADRGKTIGYQAVGVSPIRPGWSGLVPVPGDGRYEWDGYLPIEALPHVVNPPEDYFGSANNYMVPDGYPYVNALHYTWGDEMRAVRLNEVLRSGRRHTIVDMMRLQHDELSVPARNLVAFLDGVAIASPAAEDARRRLLAWDAVLGRDSVEAALYVAWERRLVRNLREIFVPASIRTLVGGVNMKKAINGLAAPDGRFGADPIAGRDRLVADSLEQALSDLEAQLGPDQADWRYGQTNFKHALIRHPLSPAVDEATRLRLDVGPVPRGGYGRTLNNTGNGDNQTSGASFRIIADTENWDHSVGTNAPGQSGNPDSSHYSDLFTLWADGKYFPVFYSRAKIESVAERTEEFFPAGSR
ncbi:MAG: penicillin acylase family protein [Vicinamibacterales bacterium]|jgi:penicillin amidase|nr:penicillin acylase family protein [Acidobacteriota bacterium]MDP7472120.1 penicillin acylase family protein [Vicinamibacterales bacterium]MDP7671007.1 penicillin acylase family protein [Vicinamibacterales bacterium]HJO38748.1 penicillin acylase family protein [Vicinamibacterales bacterium]|tara:strand:+ start:711 stop:3152 length:2442 start_codon:yes stop_codon:yes gene_type:complete